MLLMVVKNLGGLQLTIPDEDIVRALVEEVVQVMEGPLFTAALKVALPTASVSWWPLLCSSMSSPHSNELQ